MAPRQRNNATSTSSTPTSSEDESCSGDAAATSLLQEQKSGSATNAKPTQPKTSKMITEADIARDHHDYFNIVALAVVVYACAINYEYPSLSYTGEHFWKMWAATMIYFIMDLSWVKFVPTCVKSPGVIVKHHIVAMLYLAAPVYYPRYRWLMGAVLSVELNTWFLICRRLVYRSNYCPSGYAKVSPIITTTVSAFFYFTWLSIRCYLYPRVLLLFFDLWKEEIEATGNLFFWELFFIPVHFVLCVLNLKWTYDLFKPIVKRWAGIGPKSIVVQNGL